ncbi:hypothetical protein B0O99DRAFT_688033 [Bisporella sp. PMI_857]|nr:hypothetical protein B0O99DRAFT_688033 [Bisporella sp. PMI_857]
MASLLAPSLASDLYAVDSSLLNMRMGMLIPRADSTNLQTFTGALGGKEASPITSSGDSKRPFQVGTSTFPDLASAWSRSCSEQKNECADFANSDAGRGQGLKVNDCDNQQQDCDAQLNKATATSFPVLTSSDAQFDYFCDP